RKGLKATVELPDGNSAEGKVTRVGRVAEQKTGEDGTTATIEVEVSVPGLKKTFDEAPVQVTFVSARRENVLAVPVGALVALAEGGHGVQVVENGATRYAAVDTGMFADGKVEIGGLPEGTTVVVPK